MRFQLRGVTSKGHLFDRVAIVVIATSAAIASMRAMHEGQSAAYGAKVAGIMLLGALISFIMLSSSSRLRDWKLVSPLLILFFTFIAFSDIHNCFKKNPSFAARFARALNKTSTAFAGPGVTFDGAIAVSENLIVVKHTFAEVSRDNVDPKMFLDISDKMSNSIDSSGNMRELRRANVLIRFEFYDKFGSFVGSFVFPNVESESAQPKKSMTGRN